MKEEIFDVVFLGREKIQLIQSQDIFYDKIFNYKTFRAIHLYKRYYWM
ncbi:hypothetical protein IMPR6_170047 [Imperialibacter sp. EC-SDR9]|nr:hypothetical protein IMPR6_170047 [Imperialibacter sp. EC-SDR9]